MACWDPKCRGECWTEKPVEVEKAVPRYVFQVYLVGNTYEVVKGTYSNIDAAVARMAVVDATEELLTEEYLTIERYALDEAVNSEE